MYTYPMDQSVLQFIMTFIRSWIVCHSNKFVSLISFYWSQWWLIVKVETPEAGFCFTIDQSLLQLERTYIRSRHTWHKYIFIPWISVYYIWWWLVLKFETLGLSIYLYHWSLRTAANDDILKVQSCDRGIYFCLWSMCTAVGDDLY